MSDNRADKPMVTCPTCGASVRADRIATHATRCPGAAPRKSHAEASSLSPRSPAPANQGKQSPFVICPICRGKFLERHYQRHRELCSRERWAATTQQGMTPSAQRRIQALQETEDGYATQSCPICGRRVCVVPDGGFVQRFDIVNHRKSSVPHQCSDSEGRRSTLIYVNPKVGIIAQANKKRGRRKP